MVGSVRGGVEAATVGRPSRPSHPHASPLSDRDWDIAVGQGLVGRRRGGPGEPRPAVVWRHAHRAKAQARRPLDDVDGEKLRR